MQLIFKLNYNSHHKTHSYKYTIQSVLIYSQGCATTTLLKFQNIVITTKRNHILLVVAPHFFLFLLLQSLIYTYIPLQPYLCFNAKQEYIYSYLPLLGSATVDLSECLKWEISVTDFFRIII